MGRRAERSEPCNDVLDGSEWRRYQGDRVRPGPDGARLVRAGAMHDPGRIASSVVSVCRASQVTRSRAAAGSPNLTTSMPREPIFSRQTLIYRLERRHHRSTTTNPTPGLESHDLPLEREERGHTAHKRTKPLDPALCGRSWAVSVPTNCGTPTNLNDANQRAVPNSSDAQQPYARRDGHRAHRRQPGGADARRAGGPAARSQARAGRAPLRAADGDPRVHRRRRRRSTTRSAGRPC